MNKSKKISRRKFLAYSVAGLGGITGTFLGGSYLFRESEANRLLNEFPESIPSARDIRKFKTPLARHCLVHILQKHYTPKTKREDEDAIKSVQNDIYAILSYLIENYGISEVYSEGFTQEIKNQINDDVRNFLRRRKEILALNSELFEDEELRKELEGEVCKVNEGYDRLLKIFERSCGAEGRLYLEGRIILKPAETTEGRILSKDRAKRELLTDNREDILLDLISKSDDKIAVSIYGAKHAWGGKKSFGESYTLAERESYKDNIYEWNLKNPENKFSLIEVVPKSLWK